MTAEQPVRILQVVYDTYRAGIATWLVHVLRHLDRERFRVDFAVHYPEAHNCDAEIRSLGAAIRPCCRPTRPWRYTRAFAALLREHGPYDVVHSHVPFHGLVLRLARQAGVPVRIAHSHNDLPEFRPPDLLRRTFLRFTNPWIHRDATLGLGCSRKAAAALFGPDWARDPRWRLLYYGIDLKLFGDPVDRAVVRRELGIPPDARVIGHVGRFNEQKNHSFLIDIAAEVLRREPRAWLLLVGEGQRRPLIEQKVARLGLSGRVVFAGMRPDVPRLMRGGMDVFVLPSRFEGLPLVGIEAQAAGLPCVISDTITDELAVVPALMRRLPLSLPAAAWADAILSHLNEPRPVAAADALAAVRSGPFHIANCVQSLEAIYRRRKEVDR